MSFLYVILELNFVQFGVLVVVWLLGCWFIGRKR
jgi:hypothetical protein